MLVNPHAVARALEAARRLKVFPRGRSICHFCDPLELSQLHVQEVRWHSVSCVCRRCLGRDITMDSLPEAALRFSFDQEPAERHP